MTGKGTAVVTGASRGIGRATAKRLAQQHEVVAVARTAAELGTLAQEIGHAGGTCHAVPLDITDADAVARALAGVEADVLVNNAGIGIMRPLVEQTLDEWRAMVDVNFNALFYVTRVLLPGMLERGHGHIVNIGSLTGRSAYPGGACYAATKHAVVGFSESLMLEVRDAGVRVSLIMPGSVDTDFRRSGRDTSWMITADEVAEAVHFVLREAGNGLVSRIEMRPRRPGS
ncbi:MAG: SDR family oxidoreductase [Gemmatimonadaceae bacterium]